jgi:hypothetical protein
MPIFAVVSHKIYNTPGGRAVVIYITAQTAELTVFEPDGGTLSVTATRVPTGTITYQWQKAESTAPDTWTNIAGATTNTRAIASGTTVSADNGDKYRCILSSTGADTITSSEVLFTVNPVGITINTQPVNTSVSEPDTATFTVAAVSNPTGRTLSYQWQKAESTSPNTWSNIASATGTSYTTAASVVSTDNGDRYRVVVSRLSSTPVTSNAATLTVNPVTINITSQPTNQTAIETQTATFSVTATTTPTGRALTYQWQKAESTAPSTWNNIGGATGTSYTTGVLSVSADNGDKYRVVVSRLSSTPATSNEVTLTVNPILINITQQPVDATVTEPDTATFQTNSAANLGTVSYQWQVADVLTPSTWANVSTGTGGTTRTYTTAATTVPANAGDKYRCQLTVPNGSPTFTNIVTLNVNPVTINITAQPTNQSIFSGQSATFSVTAASNPTGRALTYQWQVADVLTPSSWSNISAATAASYSTGTSTTFNSNNGDLYRVVISRTQSSVTANSNSATLTVTRPTISIGAQPTDQTAFGTNTATFTASTISTNPTGRTVTAQWQKAESATPTVWSNVGTASSVAGGTTSYTTGTLTVAADNGDKYRVQLSATDALTVTSNEVTLTVDPVVISIGTQPTNQTAFATNTATFTVSASTTPVGKTISYQWQQSADGVSGWTNVSTGTGGTTASYTTASLVNSDSGRYYRVRLNSTEAAEVISNVVQLTVNPVTISVTAQPTNQTAFATSTATFSITASTTPSGRTISYQWQQSADGVSGWTNVSTGTGGTTASYTTPTLVRSDSGRYYRVTLNTSQANQVISDTVLLTVDAVLINITSQPASVSKYNLETHTFSITATTTPASRTIAYQWQKAEAESPSTWTNIGTNSSSYTTGSLNEVSDTGDRYRVLLSTSESDGATSNEAILTVTAALINIGTQPVNTSVSEPDTATFTIATTTTPAGRTVTYQWQKAEAEAPTVWSNIGTNSTSYTTPATVIANDSGDLYRVVMNAPGANETTSNEVTLTVNPVTINITSQPQSTTAGATTTATFTVVASTTPSGRTLSYQWQKSESGSPTWSDITDATGTSYTTGALTVAADNGDRYRVAVSRTLSGASVNSIPATLTVEPVTITINTQPTNQTATQGGTATFSVSSSVDYSVTQTYQWQKAESTSPGVWNNISGATDSSYTTGVLLATTDDGDLYRVVISAPGASSVTSSSVTLSVTYIASVDYLLVGGGGGGGGSAGNAYPGGGGGAGGLRYFTAQSFNSGTSYSVSIGTGGTGGTAAGTNGTNGVSSSLNAVSAAGGGFGGGAATGQGNAGSAGGSGGGGSRATAGGAGNTPTVSPSQGNNGGSAATTAQGGGGGGGGGAGGAGGSSTTAVGASGGIGATYFGAVYAAGGAGGTDASGTTSLAGTAGTDGLGNGGSGAGGSTGGSGGAGGAGGDGIVALRYVSTLPDLTVSGLTFTLDTTTFPGFKFYKFTSGSGNITWP